MRLFVDTSVWSLAFRRDTPEERPAVEQLNRALGTGGAVFTTGLVLQELLQGFHGPKDKAALLGHFSCLPFIVPDRGDHERAAELRNLCRRQGVQIATIDALLARLCIRHGLTMLTADSGFARVAALTNLALA